MGVQMISASSKATLRALEVVFQNEIQYNITINSYANPLPEDIKYCNYLHIMSLLSRVTLFCFCVVALHRLLFWRPLGGVGQRLLPPNWPKDPPLQRPDCPWETRLETGSLPCDEEASWEEACHLDCYGESLSQGPWKHRDWEESGDAQGDGSHEERWGLW